MTSFSRTSQITRLSSVDCETKPIKEGKTNVATNTKLNKKQTKSKTKMEKHIYTQKGKRIVRDFFKLNFYKWSIKSFSSQVSSSGWAYSIIISSRKFVLTFLSKWFSRKLWLPHHNRCLQIVAPRKCSFFSDPVEQQSGCVHTNQGVHVTPYTQLFKTHFAAHFVDEQVTSACLRRTMTRMIVDALSCEWFGLSSGRSSLRARLDRCGSPPHFAALVLQQLHLKSHQVELSTACLDTLHKIVDTVSKAISSSSSKS